jgi:hypothetical protein
MRLIAFFNRTTELFCALELADVGSSAKSSAAFADRLFVPGYGSGTTGYLTPRSSGASMKTPPTPFHYFIKTSRQHG